MTDPDASAPALDSQNEQALKAFIERQEDERQNLFTGAKQAMTCFQTLDRSIPKFGLSKKQGIVLPWLAKMKDVAHFCEDSLGVRVSDKMKITTCSLKFDGVVEK